MQSITQHYQQALAQQILLPDEQQENAVHALERLVSDLTKPRKRKIFSFGTRTNFVQGIYLFGPVGRGKTMMMSWCLEALAARQKRVERWHFHAFMLALHNRLRDLAVHSKDLENRIQSLADEWVERLDVLCFDEFHVTDVADAMIMMPLFSRFFDRGLVVVATSNWAPDELYSGGLQRQRFLPFIAHLKESMQIINVSGSQDYRALKQHSLHSWLSPLNDETAETMDIQFRDLVGYDPIETHELHVGKRSWTIPRASKKIAWLDMAALLDQPLGAADFLALAQRYNTLFLDNLPVFGPDQNERAKRFMVMIDNFYEFNVKLVVRAATSPDSLYPENGKLAFEFARTRSRLNEMLIRIKD